MYNGTTIMVHLIQTWDLFDKQLIDLNSLRIDFRVMRKIVSDSHVNIVFEYKLIERLLKFIKNENSDPGLLPDALFLLGSLAVIYEIKVNKF